MVLERVRLPEDRAALTAWLEDARPAADRHFDRHKAWKEWWCVAELLKRQEPDRPFIPLDCEIWKREGPDFFLRCANVELFLEVSEATDQRRDRREIALSRGKEGTTLVGDEGGRFKDGALGDEYEEAMESDIRRAAEKKAREPYASNCCLLLLNANSLAFGAKPSSVTDRFSPYRSTFPFLGIAVLLPDRHLMIWTPDETRLIGPRQ